MGVSEWGQRTLLKPFIAHSVKTKNLHIVIEVVEMSKKPENNDIKYINTVVNTDSKENKNKKFEEVGAWAAVL